MTLRSALLFLLAAGSLAAGDGGPQQVTQEQIDDAIDKGIKYIKETIKDGPTPGHGESIKNSDELILWTLIHAQVEERDPLFQRLLKAVYEAPLTHTYKVALQAMCLEELDRVWYQGRIAQCAQALANAMCKNGQWSYGATAEPVKEASITALKPPPPPPKKTPGAVKVVDRPAPREKPKVVRTVAIKKEKEGGAEGDNSNSQYGVLGLRACFDAGIRFPQDFLSKGKLWWVQSQHAADEKDKAAVSTGKEHPPRGWSYKGANEGGSSHTMSSGGVSSVVIYDYMLGADWKKDPAALSGVNWLAAKFVVNENGYYMYGLERAAILFDTTTLGKHDWYLEGARHLVERQKANGSWGNDKTEGWPNSVWDTCFAVLFLKKATRPLVATEGGGRK
jgi:hypothetical protein